MTDLRRILYVHIGTHKTGTTSFQAFLRNNVSVLASAGIYIPTAGTISTISGHHNIAWQLCGDTRYSEACGSIDTLAKEIENCGADKAILSSEDFGHLISVRSGFNEIESKFNSIGWDVCFIIVFRDQKSYAWSLYREFLKHRYVKSYQYFLWEVLTKGVVSLTGNYYEHFNYYLYLERLRDLTHSPVKALSYNKLIKEKQGLIKGILNIVVDDNQLFDISITQEYLNTSNDLHRNTREFFYEQCIMVKYVISNIRLFLRNRLSF